MLPSLFAKVANLNLSGLPHTTADSGTVKTIITIVIWITGAICMLMITIAGFRYITSQGDPQAVSKAKRAIIFSLVGLAVVVLAQAIVAFAWKEVSS